MTTTEQPLSRQQAIQQVLREFAGRSGGFLHSELVARVAELGHAEPPTIEEVLAEQDQAIADQHKAAQEWLERSAKWLDRHIAEARQDAEEMGEDGDILLHVCVRAKEIEALQEGLQRVARMMKDIILKPEMGR
jgi:hypothetical protein